MGMRQLSMFVGPVLAGVIISVGANSQQHTLADARGMGLAFSVDAVSFLFSLASLAMVRIHSDRHPPKASVVCSWTWWPESATSGSDLPLRAFILYAAVVSVFVGGPIQVGLPVLANTRLDLGAASLGY